MSANAAQVNTTTAAKTETANPSKVELMLKKDTASLVKQGRNYYSMENGQGKFDDDFYEKMLPEGITMETVNTLDKHNSNLIAATALIHGEHAVEAAKQNKDMRESSVAFKAGNHTVTHTWKRESTGFNPKTKEPTKTFSTVKTAVKFSGTKNSGDLGRVRSHLQTIGASVLVD